MWKDRERRRKREGEREGEKERKREREKERERERGPIQTVLCEPTLLIWKHNMTSLRLYFHHLSFYV